jgi:DNA topoisomerase-3
MNFTRFYTLGAGKLFSVGRVQTPTLALIAKRTEEIESFSSKSYYEIGATFTHEELPGYYLGCLNEILSFPSGFKKMAMSDDSLSLSHEDSPKDSFNNSSKDSGKDKKSCYKFSDLPNCQVIEADLTNSTASLNSFDKKLKLTPPPELFDLTELQREANKRFHFTADKTLKVAQSLYERHKVISYPRTDSRHLTEDVAKDFVGRMAKMSQAFPDLGFEFKPPGLRYVDASKVTDHHAMIPVGKASSLSGDEQRIYDLILMRSLQIFLPSRRVNESRILTDVKGGEGQYVFHSQNSEEIHPGWTGLEKHFSTLPKTLTTSISAMY